ncbi:MAG TPA: hypothetical protein VGC66_22780 [Pyrinomonadaceae bacterium]|jgi:hypothetical protein
MTPVATIEALVDDNKFEGLSRKIYDDYRTALLNQLYYACRLARYKRYNLLYEIILALGTSGTIAAWYAWRTDTGKIAWAFYAGVVAILTVIKPIVNLPREIERFSKQNAGYRDVYYDLNQLIDDIELNLYINGKMLDLYGATKKRSRELAPDDDPQSKEKLLRKIQFDVNKSKSSYIDWYTAIEQRRIKENNNVQRRA